MRGVWIFLAALAAVIFVNSPVQPASAQAARTWVSGVGDDANPCSRTAPCQTFAGAIAKTAAGGEINCLDPGGFGSVTITMSVAIVCDNTEGGVLVSGTNGITINAGPTDVVTLRGLDIKGMGTGLNGISFVQGGVLHVEFCTINGFTQGPATGLSFTPPSSAKLFVSDTIVSENGTGTTGGGIIVKPSGSGAVFAEIKRVQAKNNVLGIRADGGGGAASISLAVTDSEASGNTYAGMAAFTSGPAVTYMISRSVSSANGVGVNANGVTAIMRVGNSVIQGNLMGTTISNGATMTSYGTNQINDNATPGQNIPVSGPN